MNDLADIHTVVMQVTDKCPFDCKQCYTKKGHTFLPLIKAEHIIDRVFRNRNGLLQITGGEPLLYPDLDELLSFCYRRDICTAIATSGYGCSEERIKLLKNAGLNYFFVSLNGSTQEIHEQTRFGFKEALAAIQNAKKVGLSCFVNWVACQSNADDFSNVIALCKRLGADALYILKKRISFSGLNSDFPTDRQINELRKQINCQAYFKIVIEQCFNELLNVDNVCRAGEESFYIDCSGKFSPCSKLSHYKFNSFNELQNNNNKWLRMCQSKRC